MTFDNNFDLDEAEPEEAPESASEGSSNRTFILIAGILAAIMLLTLLCTAVYAFFFLPRSRSANATQAAEVLAQNTAMALSVEQTEAAARITPTATVTHTPLPPTPIPTNTQVVARPTSVIELPTEPGADPRTATVAALLTKAAEAQLTIIPTSTGLPETGFAEDVGLPGLIGLAMVLVVIVFLARRLRTAH